MEKIKQELQNHTVFTHIDKLIKFYTSLDFSTFNVCTHGKRIDKQCILKLF